MIEIHEVLIILKVENTLGRLGKSLRRWILVAMFADNIDCSKLVFFAGDRVLESPCKLAQLVA
jgi:hypothetical protein